jgi:hypothetical protein
MESDGRIRQAICDIASHPKNVTLEDILWVVNKLKDSYTVKERPATHGLLISINGRMFSICTHHRGSKQLKPQYVNAFLDVMAELGLYEE